MGLDSQLSKPYKPQMDQLRFFFQNVDLEQFGKCPLQECAFLPVIQHSCTPHLTCYTWLVKVQSNEFGNPQNLEAALDC